MKMLETRLTEAEIRARMARLCRPKEKRARDYADREAFIYEEKPGSFWLGSYHAVGNKNPGLAAERINGQYRVREDGLVTVVYRHANHPSLFITYLLTLVAGLVLAGVALAELWRGEGGQGGNHLFTLFLLALGTVGLIGRPGERRALEAHLRYICRMDESAAETEADGAELDLSGIYEVYPLRLVCGGQAYLTLYSYAEDGVALHLLHGGGHPVCFRDPAQMLRFCQAHGLETEGEPATVCLDFPIAEDTPPARILERWNHLAHLAHIQGLSFAGDDDEHAPLYECLFTRALPTEEGPECPWSAEQLREFEQVFAGQAALAAGFRTWRE